MSTNAMATSSRAVAPLEAHSAARATRPGVVAVRTTLAPWFVSREPPPAVSPSRAPMRVHASRPSLPEGSVAAVTVALAPFARNTGYVTMSTSKARTVMTFESLAVAPPVV